MNTFGARLRALREAKSLSQERLGFELGTSKATISKWENGKGEPSLAQLAKLRDFFSDMLSGLDDLVCGAHFLAGGRPGGFRVSEDVAGYEANPRVAGDAGEVAVLAAYRSLSPKRRRAVLDLLASD